MEYVYSFSIYLQTSSEKDCFLENSCHGASTILSLQIKATDDKIMQNDDVEREAPPTKELLGY